MSTATDAPAHELLEPELPIQTERLLLRPFEADDFDPLLEIHSRPDVARYVPWEPRNAAALRPVFERKLYRWPCDESNGLSLAVILRDGGALIGDASVFSISSEHLGAEIGFLFHPDHHGRGYAREANEILLRLAFENLGLHRVVGRADARNISSTRLMERLGMRREAHFVANEWLKGEWTDEVVYAILREEWERTR
jgi:RimJ/RimL family protein N-acetyltransferase